MQRRVTYWKLRQSELRLGERTLIMGVLNVTPDSFSDGGRYSDADRAFARALELEEEGADIIDIGAESTRPGSARISAEEEWRRLAPLLKRLKDKLSVPVSIDTYKAETAQRALDLGVEIINDPSALTFDPELAKIVAGAGAGLVLNHMRGTPETWAKLPSIPAVMGAIVRDLGATISRALHAGVEKSRVVIDPGLGFGKRREQNSEIIARLGELAALEYPVLIGPSRKSFLAQGQPEETEFATAAAVTASILNGAHIVRVHDVKALKAAVAIADTIVNATPVPEPEEEPVRKPRGARAPGPLSESAAPKPTRPPIRLAAPKVAAAPAAAEATEVQGETEGAEVRPAAAAAAPDVAPVIFPEDRAVPRKREYKPRDAGDRPARSFDRDSRDRDSRPPRRFGSDDRPPRRFEGGDRPPRRFDRDDRPPRKFAAGDRPPRKFEGGDRPPRKFDGDRPPRKFDGDRPPRKFEGGDRPPRRFDSGDRPPRKFGTGDRPPRKFDGGDRPPRKFEGRDGDSKPFRKSGPPREGGGFKRFGPPGDRGAGPRPEGRFGGPRPPRDGGDRRGPGGPPKRPFRKRP